MTPTQLDALLGLLNPREGQTIEVLRLVFVDQIAQAEVARRLGMSRSGVGAAVQRGRKIIALAEVLVDQPAQTASMV
jgi:predicted DNA-binding protein (UPF0251 family)